MSSPYDICVIPGDGVGPEVVAAELAVLEATGLDFNFRHYPAGDAQLASGGRALPDETLAAAHQARAVIFGAVGNTAAEVILRLRAELGTWVNLRPAKAYQGVKCLHPQTDIMVVRENTQGMYTGVEAELLPGVTTATRLISREASLRIARCAFKWAQDNGRAKVTAVHKANVLRLTDSLFVACCRQAAGEFEDIAYEEALVDSVAMRLVMRPQEFDVIVTTNLFGDILSDLTAGLIGGLGMCPSANLGDGQALFEPVHGTAPDIAGQGKANPTAAILCGAMLLHHLGQAAAAEKVEVALGRALAGGQTTPDLGGSLGTMEMARAVIAEMS